MSGRQKHGSAGHERWLVSYADFITLLFAFFVVLYAVAKSEKHSESEVAVSVNSAFKALAALPEFNRRNPAGTANDTTAQQDQPPQTRLVSAARARADLKRMESQLEQALSAQIAAHIVSMKIGPNGLIISLHEAGFFKSGSADPLPESAKILGQIGLSLHDSPYDVRVEGHTDNVPIHTARFASNWELSSARAVNIARLLLTLRGVPPDRLSAAGFGEFHPVATNATAEGRAANRRVDLVVFPEVQLGVGSESDLGAKGPWRRIVDGGLESAPPVNR